MAVRKTESQIPGGILQVDRLGENDKDRGNNIALISYLPKPLKYIERTNELSENTYIVLFKEMPTGSDAIEFQWELSLYKQGQTDPMYTKSVGDSEKGYLTLNKEITRNLWCLYIAVKIKIKVTVTGYPPIELEQDIKRSSGNIRDLLSNNSVNNSVGGAPAVTRKIAACYKEYFDNIEDIDPKVGKDKAGLKKNLIIAIVYYTLLKNLDKSDAWEKTINNGDYTFQKVKNACVGISGLCPGMAATLLKTDYTSGTPSLITVPGADSAGTPYLERAFNQFKTDYGNASNISVAIDLVNLLRFPKTAIEICGLFLEKVRKDLGYDGDPWNKIIQKHTESKLMDILKCYFNGPDTPNTKKTIATDVLSLLNSGFVKMLASIDICSAFRNLTSIGLSTGHLSTNSTADDFKNSTIIEFMLTQDVTRLDGSRTYGPIDYEIHYNGARSIFKAVILYTLNTGKVKTYSFYFRLDYLICFNDQYPLYDDAGTKWDEKYENTVMADLVRTVLKDRKGTHFIDNECCLLVDDDASDSFAATERLWELEKILGRLRSEMRFFINKILEFYCDAPATMQAELLEKLTDLETFLKKIDSVGNYLLPAAKNFPSDLSIDVRNDTETNIFNPYFSIQPDRYGEDTIPPYDWENMFFSQLHVVQFALDEPNDITMDISTADGKPFASKDEIAKMANAFTKIIADKEKTSVPVKLVIRGYADKSYKGTGSRKDYNDDLSLLRADWIKSQLFISTGLTDAEIEVKTFGCGHTLAAGLIGIDNEGDLEKQKYRDVRMVLMPK